MTDQHRDQAFLQAVVADPADDATRLIYADWLEEQGDPRAHYLRLEVELAAVPPEGDEATEVRDALLGLRSRISPRWLAVLDQPGVLRAPPTPFPADWWGTDLGRYRSCAGTYENY